MADSERDNAGEAGTTETPEAISRLGDNPFYVLGLRPGSSRTEIEREGQKLLAMLELGLSKAQRYPSPVGERTRTVDKVREAMAELRHPDRRIVHELWARLPPEPIASASGVASDDAGGDPESAAAGGSDGRTCAWSEARRAAGWEPRR